MRRAWFFLFQLWPIFAWMLWLVASFTVGFVAMSAWPEVALGDEFFQECAGEPGMLDHDFSVSRLNEIDRAAQEARENSERSPFRLACQMPGLLRKRPETGLFHRSVPFTDWKGRSSADFFKRLGARVLESMDGEELRLQVYEECLSGKMAAHDEACGMARDWFSKELLPSVRDARMNLALAQTTGEIQTATFQHASLKVNSSLSSLGTQKLEAWQKLTDAEQKTAEIILKEYEDESAETSTTQAVAKKLTGPAAEKFKREFKNDAILAARYKNGLAYVEALSRYPILQYLKTAEPSKDEVIAALKTMRKHLASDRQFAERALQASQKTFRETRARSGIIQRSPLSSMDPDALGLLEFTSHVERELLDTPHDCGLVTSLQYTKENRALGNGLAIGVPLIVASFALPVAGQVMAGAVLGGAAGIGFAVQSKFDRDLAAQRFASKIEALDDEDYKKLDQADRNFKISLALGPAMMAAGPAARYAMVGLRAAKQGIKMSRAVPKKTLTEGAK